jgi:hypothetical protein
MRQCFVGNGCGIVIVSRPVVGMVQNERGSGSSRRAVSARDPGSVPWRSVWGFMALGQAFFKGAFAKLRIPVTIVVSVCPSAWNNSDLTGRIFTKFCIWLFFETLSRIVPVSLASGRNNGHFTWRPMYFYDGISLNSQNENIFGHSFFFFGGGGIKKHFLCSINLFPRKSCWVRDSVEIYGTAGQATDDDIMWRMRFALWRTKATHTHTHTLVSLMSVAFHQCPSTMGSIRSWQLSFVK